jgi:predicted GNAT family acetyltransferase
LVAVAGYTVWGDVIAHIAVITHPQYRGQGYGRAVVSRLTEEVLRQGLVPQYRTLEANQPSMAIARTLGFAYYATTVAVRLKPDATEHTP